MPEHRNETPVQYQVLESFLWHDFGQDLKDWALWLERKMPYRPVAGISSTYQHAMRLHAALRTLQSANSGEADPIGLQGAREALNRLIARYRITPQLNGVGHIFLVANPSTDPAALLLISFLEASNAGVWRRFKLCSEPTCRASYYDASKATAKSWCSMQTCGSRNKMRRFRSKL